MLQLIERISMESKKKRARNWSFPLLSSQLYPLAQVSLLQRKTKLCSVRRGIGLVLPVAESEKGSRLENP